MNRVNIAQSLIAVLVTVYVALYLALWIYPSYGEQGFFEILRHWKWLGIFYLPRNDCNLCDLSGDFS